MKKAVAGISLILVFAFMAGIARSGALETLFSLLDSLTTEGFNALRGV